MLLSVVSVLVVAQSSSEVPEGLMNNPVYKYINLWKICSVVAGGCEVPVFKLYVVNIKNFKNIKCMKRLIKIK